MPRGRKPAAAKKGSSTAEKSQPSKNEIIEVDDNVSDDEGQVNNGNEDASDGLPAIPTSALTVKKVILAPKRK